MNRKRLESETFEEYKENLRAENKQLKERLKGKLIWNSSGGNGTYVFKKHGKIGSE
jgi:hypothetical protein